jgi:glutathione S-transferase
MALSFYHGHGSPYSWRVFLALEYLAVPYELKLLSFEAKDTTKPEFVAINPRHQVPTIVDEGFALWESIPILEYLDDRFGKDGGPRMYAGNPRGRARTRLIVREIEEYLTAAGIDAITGELFFSHGREPDLAKVDQGRQVIADELADLAKRLDGEFFGGASPSAADLVLYPAYGYLKRITFRKPETKLTEVVPEKLAQWAARMEALPFLDKTIPSHWR